MKIYLVVLDDDGTEIQSAWSTEKLAQEEIARQLSLLKGRDFYWMENRLNMRELQIDAQPFFGY